MEMKDDHMHDRFLFIRDNAMVFGCVNPFCAHGRFGTPIMVTIPLYQTEYTMAPSHQGRILKIEIWKEGTKIMCFTCDDNLEACEKAWNEAFKEKKDV